VERLREETDAVLDRIPVLGLDLAVDLSESVSFDLLVPKYETPARIARLALGDCPHACRTDFSAFSAALIRSHGLLWQVHQLVTAGQ
jgi:hypothetical protein